ncbi:hypothetical protein FACS189425_10420 [Clostridia bacterium]|nr:hypothetical protein FACS189425_10420 [Clostridia bacterium]
MKPNTPTSRINQTTKGKANAGGGRVSATKQLITENLWLEHYNRTLFERGLISEVQRNRIASKIAKRK